MHRGFGGAGKRVDGDPAEETNWIGGQLTARGVPPDEHRWIESFGCMRSYQWLRDSIRDWYRTNYPLSKNAMAAVQLNPGNGLVFPPLERTEGGVGRVAKPIATP